MEERRADEDVMDGVPSDQAGLEPAKVRVTVQLFGIRRELIDRPEVTVVLPAGTTPRQLLVKLGEEFGPRVARKLLVGDGKYLGHDVCLAVNDVVITPASLDIPLSKLGGEKPEVSLAVVFSISGGQRSALAAHSSAQYDGSTDPSVSV